MRKANANTLQAFVGENAAGTILAWIDNSFCSIGSNRTGLVRKKTFP